MPNQRASRPFSHLLPIFAVLFGALAAPGCDRQQPEVATEVIARGATIAPWAPGVAYAVGALVTHAGVTYRCRLAHTAQVGQQPPVTPNLWERPGSAGINPWTNQTVYVVGSGVTYGGKVYRCLQGHNSQTDWTPPAAPTLWKLTGNVQIPSGLSGTLAFVFKSKKLPAGITDGFGLVHRDPFGDPSYAELLDTTQRSVGEVFHRMRVQGGEILELYLQANKTKATSSPSMTAKTYSSDPTMNTTADPTRQDHVAQPLQDAGQQMNNIWSLRWESFHGADAGRDGLYDDVVIELRLEAPCDGVQIPCPDPGLVVSSHNTTVADYRGDFAAGVVGPVAGVPAGPVKDPTGGEGNASPFGTGVFLGGRVDTLRWSFVQESTDFSAATPPETGACPQCTPPTAAQLGGGLWSLQIDRIHRPRAEAQLSSFGPGVFSNFDAKLILQPGGIGNQNSIVLFDPKSDAPPVTFFELSQQDGDSSVDGRYRDTATRMFSSLTLFNASGGVEPNPSSARTAVATRQNGEQLKFEIINDQAGATQLRGRLTALQDRNGNAAAVTYQFAATSTDTALGGDRKKLWLINRATDPHGVAATFTYERRAATARWVVSSIALPDATSLQYQYGTDPANLDRLTRVVYHNGDASVFTRSWDSDTQSWAITFQDAMGGDAQTWKTVYLTGATFTTPDDVTHSQEPNLVRRIVNSDGEQVYGAMEDPNDANTTFFRDGGDRITRLKVDSTGLPREVARATTAVTNPLQATYTPLETYSGDFLGMIQKATDGLGNTRTFGRDSKTRGITSVTPRGAGSPATLTLNAFLKPTKTIDRLGRVTNATYDAKGNILTLTHAAGTSVQAGWTYTYNSKGQVTKVTDPNTKVTDYGYNAAGFLTSISDPPDVTGGTRAVQTFEYYPSGRLLASVDASGRRVTFAYDQRGRLTTTTYPDGTTETITYGSGATADLVTERKNRNDVVETYDYDASRRLNEVVKAANRPEEVTTTIEYLPGTLLVSARTERGERTEIGHDERQRPTSRTVFVRGDVALVSETTFDALDRPVAETDPYGRRVLRVFDANNRVTRTVTELVPGGVPAGVSLPALPRVTTPNPPYVIEDAAYDAMNQYASTTDGRGVVTAFTFDAQGRRSSVTRASGKPEARKTTYEHDPAGNLLKEIHPRTFTEGMTFQTVYTYTGRNLVASKTEASGSADAATTTFTWSPTRKLLTTTDPRAGVITNSYEACCDRLSSVKDAGDFITRYTYDGVGNRLTITNPLGAVTRYAYDGHNRLVGETDALGKSTVHVHDDDLTDTAGIDPSYAPFIAELGLGAGADGSAVQTTNAENERTLTARDGAGRVVLHVNAGNKATYTTHDALTADGLVETSVKDPLGNFKRRRSDGAGHARVLVDALDKLSTRGFDASGNQLSDRDPNGVGRDCSFDGLGQQTGCTDTRGDVNTAKYDAAGNRIETTTGAAGSVIRKTCTYDFRNRRKTCTDGVLAVTRWSYDKNSNITSVTDGETRVTSYTYDARNLRRTETLPDSSGATDLITYEFDGAGRLSSRKDQSGKLLTYVYDSADRLRQKTDADGMTDSFEYDDVGRFKGGTSQRYGTSIVQDYDDAGRLSLESLALPSPEPVYTVGYHYDDGDRLRGLEYPDGSLVTRDLTKRDQLDAVFFGEETIARFTRDEGGRVTGTTFGNGLVETRSYRTDDRLSAISTPGVGDFTYDYDGHKRKLSEGGVAGQGAQTFGYDGEGRITGWNNGASTQSWSLSPVGDWRSITRNGATETRTHNLAHELTAIGTATLGYDPRGNLVSDDRRSTLAWDLENRLLSFTKENAEYGVSYLYDVLGRRVARTEGSVRTVLVHAGNEVIQELVNGDPSVTYILGETIDRPLAYLAGGNLRWYSANHLGTVGAVTDQTGAVIERYRYDAYGARTVLSPGGSTLAASAVANQVGFTGRPHDAYSGLVDLRFRQYDPRLGRFVSRDDAYRDGLNLYGAYYVPNATDPSGHCAIGGGAKGCGAKAVACAKSGCGGGPSGAFGPRGASGAATQWVAVGTTRSLSSLFGNGGLKLAGLGARDPLGLPISPTDPNGGVVFSDDDDDEEDPPRKKTCDEVQQECESGRQTCLTVHGGLAGGAAGGLVGGGCLIGGPVGCGVGLLLAIGWGYIATKGIPPNCDIEYNDCLHKSGCAAGRTRGSSISTFFSVRSARAPDLRLLE